MSAEGELCESRGGRVVVSVAKDNCSHERKLRRRFVRLFAWFSSWADGGWDVPAQKQSRRGGEPFYHSERARIHARTMARRLDIVRGGWMVIRWRPASPECFA